MNHLHASMLIAFGLLTAARANGQEPERVEFQDVFEWTGTLTLQETDAVLNVAPRLQRDPLGGWIVSDAPEAQVRLYDRRGRLRGHFGRRGDGPGELRNLVGAVRIRSGLLVAVGEAGRIQIWSPDGSELITVFNSGLNNITGVLPLGDSILLATAPTPKSRNETAPPTLHVLAVSDEQMVSSFGRPNITPNAVAAMAMVLGGGLDHSGDTLLVTLPLIDSLWVYPNSGAASRRALPLRSRFLSGTASIPDGFRDPDGLRGWLRNATFVGPVHAAPGFGWAVTLLRYGRNSRPGLLYIPPSRTSWYEIETSPALLGLDDSTGEYVFQDPDALEPGRLKLARVRQQFRR